MLKFLGLTLLVIMLVVISTKVWVLDNELEKVKKSVQIFYITSYTDVESRGQAWMDKVDRDIVWAGKYLNTGIDPRDIYGSKTVEKQSNH